MKIIASECWAEKFELKESYSIAYQKDITHCDNVFLTLETESGLTGWGMAAPDMIVTGEDTAAVLQSYHGHIEACMKGENPFYCVKLYPDRPLRLRR